jgi:hypothetical protein
MASDKGTTYGCTLCGNTVTLMINPTYAPVCSNRKHREARIMTVLGSGEKPTIVPEAPKEKRGAKSKAAAAWVKDHAGEQIAPKDLAAILNWNYQGALKYMKENIGMFVPIKRGLFEVRDPDVERALAKGSR